MTPTELVEAVAEAMELCPNSSEHMALAAIRVVIEEIGKKLDKENQPMLADEIRRLAEIEKEKAGE